MSNFSLQDKTVIVTGGAGGLGRPMCAIFAAASANVIVASRSRDKIEAEAASLREQGYSAAAIEVDVTDEQQVNNLIEQTVSTFGAVDVMVNKRAAGDAVLPPKIPSSMNGERSWSKTSPVFFCPAKLLASK